LTRAEIVTAALSILDEFGLADLSMRRIAATIGVRPGALYWHVDNKQSLLAAVAEEMLTGVTPPDGPEPEAVAAYADSLREHLLAHRDGAEVVSAVLAMRLPIPLRSPVAELATVLESTPMSGARAEAAAALVVHFVIGHTLDCQGHAQSRAFGITDGADIDFGSRFATGLAMLLAGITGAGHQ
jgi:TetR/AcrR family tetracycline transcriptional repressor